MKCCSWKDNTYKTHMLLLEFVIGFLHSKLKVLEQKYETNHKATIKEKGYLQRQKSKMINVYERYGIPERLLPQDPETLRHTRFWDKHLTEKEEYWELLNV